MERQYYLWTVGGSTVSVALARDVIERLREVALSREPGEIGGILLGRRESDERIAIEGFELLSSEHRRGVTYTLSQSDRKKLSQRLRSTHHGLQTLGSFRTHRRQGLYMDQYDYELMSSHFASPTDVMLLFRPGDWHAGFFVWEEGDIQRQKSYREFTFNSAVLPMTVITTSGPFKIPDLTIEMPETKPQPVPWRVIPLLPRPSLPTLAKVGLTAATFGLVGVLAFYAHEHRNPTPPTALASTVAANTPLPATDIHPPVNPDHSLPPKQTPVDEMHVKLPEPATRPSPFDATSHNPQPQAVIVAKPAPSPAPYEPPQPSTTASVPPPPVQTAVNLPPTIEPLVLKPAGPTIVSTVSVEPAQPGAISRSIKRIPVLSLLERHRYKAGENFSPARPVRQVTPRLPTDLQADNSYPLPVDVKVWIDKTGQVTKAELLTDSAEPEVADIASNAALKWTFQPARISDHPVDSQMVMHFRFAPKSY